MVGKLISISLSLFLLERIAAVVYTQSDLASVGEWLPSQTLPYTPVSAALLPTGKVFFFDQYEKADNVLLGR